jgi:hypothetical protein
MPPFAMTVIAPMFWLQSVGLVDVTDEMFGCVKVGMTQFGTLDVQAAFPPTILTITLYVPEAKLLNVFDAW